MRALLLRLGGLGDIIILTSVAAELKRRGYEVDGCFGSPTGDMRKILEPIGCFDNIIEQLRYINGEDMYKVSDTEYASTELLRRQYDLGIEYKFSVELNSHYRELANSPGKEWMISQNSNYVNWMDIMFAWAGIDPTEVAPENKIPLYTVLPEEENWARSVLRIGDPDLVFTIQTNASSLTRTWYHPQRLPEAIREKYADKKVAIAVFDGAQWVLIKGKHNSPIKVPRDMDPIRASAALVGASTVFIGADSGFSHIAEALKVRSVTTYTTVPSWTRMGYYRYAKAVEPVGKVFNNVPCRPCFVLDRHCPRIREKALKELTPREQTIKAAMEQGREPHEVAVELNTTPQGIVHEAQFLQQRLQALLDMQAPCTETITTDRIMEKVLEAVDESSS